MKMGQYIPYLMGVFTFTLKSIFNMKPLKTYLLIPTQKDNRRRVNGLCGSTVAGFQAEKGVRSAPPLAIYLLQEGPIPYVDLFPDDTIHSVSRTPNHYNSRLNTAT
jgi:hypothetical protein